MSRPAADFTNLTALSPRAGWHFVTGEYPPQPGGVSDYSQQLAIALAAAGEEVHVWAPLAKSTKPRSGVTLHGIPGFGPRGLGRLSAGLAAIAGPKRLLIQYVAQAFGYRGLNIPFAFWLALRREELWVQFHEVAYVFQWGEPFKRIVLTAVQGWMAQLAAGNAQRIFISIPAWRRQLGRHASRAEVLPIFSNLPIEVVEQDRNSLRKLLGEGPLVGHFGTYGSLIEALLAPAVVSILRSVPAARFLLVGRGSTEFVARFSRGHPDLATRLTATGAVEAPGAALHLSACDVLIQPYPDGISGRRTSAMAGLALGKAVVSTTGYLTEADWSTSDAVLLAPVGDNSALTSAVARLLFDEAERQALAGRGRSWYQTRFSLDHTLALLGVKRAP